MKLETAGTTTKSARTGQPRTARGPKNASLFRYFCEEARPRGRIFRHNSDGGTLFTDMLEGEAKRVRFGYAQSQESWEETFGHALAAAVSIAVDRASSQARRPSTVARRAVEWFVSGYPLLEP